MPAAAVPIVHPDLSIPAKLITQLVVQPSRGARWQKKAALIIELQESLAAIPVDVKLADNHSAEEWERLLNIVQTSIALVEGAVGRQTDAAVRRNSPRLARRYMRSKRTMLTLMRSFAERVEDKIDAM